MGTIQLHQGEVTKLIVSPDGKHLFSAGSDGTLFTLTMTDLQSEPIPGIRQPGEAATSLTQTTSSVKPASHAHFSEAHQ